MEIKQLACPEWRAERVIYVNDYHDGIIIKDPKLPMTVGQHWNRYDIPFRKINECKKCKWAFLRILNRCSNFHKEFTENL